ncbi:pre-mRNA-splicing factor CWC25 homolog [Cylas formicarius]|uniref:pre-mRNA-splicing factor CWC25 homolog n=1 Tax=Cylas formicarius TaxID=197179 RepID=UPI002958C792|nr:pre-mRNA-splicing factor CWC25 homolog [Cylas formicarius]
MANEEKLEWIYKGANSLVNREEYLLGRSVDKALELKNEEEKEKKFVLPVPKNHVEHECIPPSIRDFNKIVQAEQVDLSTKLQEDPLVAIRKQEEEARRKFLQNPVQLKKLQEALQAQQKKKQKKSKKKQMESDLDNKIMQKLKLLKSGFSSHVTEKKGHVLDTILMHKFNALKDKLSEEDLNDVLNGKLSETSDEEKPKRKKRYSKSPSNRHSDVKKCRKDNNKVKSKCQHHDTLSEYSDDCDDTVKKSYDSSKVHSGEKSKCRANLGKQKKTEWKRKDSECFLDSKTNNIKKLDKSRYSIKKINAKAKSVPHSKYESSDSDDLDNKIVTNVMETGNPNNLDEIIMEKLKILRGETEQKTLYPKKPKHLKRENSNCSSTSSRSSSSSSSSNESNDSDDKSKRNMKAFGLVTSRGKKIRLKHEVQGNVKPNTKKKIESSEIKLTIPDRNSKKLTEKEKERLRREMMVNAEVRDKEREANVKRYKEKDNREEEAVTKKYNKDFIHNALLKTAKPSSVEDRIKSNVNNIQRSFHMNENFFKR